MQRLCIILLVTAFGLGNVSSATAVAEAEISHFNRARTSFIKDHSQAFAKHAQKIAADSPYQPLLGYWRGVLALRRNNPPVLEALATASPSPYIRRQATKTLAQYYLQKRQWRAFGRIAEVSPCPRLLWRLHQGDADRDAIRELWNNEKHFNDTLCLSLYRQALAKTVLNDNDLWLKLRVFAGNRQLSLTRRFLRKFQLPVSYKQVRRSVLKAVAYIRGKHGLASRAQRELVMISAIAAAKPKLSTAIKRWQDFSPYFPRADVEHVWANIATWAAKAHNSNALSLYRRSVSTASYNNNMRAWRVRAALRAGDFADVEKTIESMPPQQAALSAWRYWRALAIRENGRTDEAAQHMRALAADTDDYYGLLAREESSLPLFPDSSLTTAVVTTAAKTSGDFSLALAVWLAGHASAARRIWHYASKHAEPAVTLAAARAAANAEWYLASINAANQVGESAMTHELRYPLPYRNTIDKYSDKFGLERAFVYGLIRQESRFTPAAVSSAKARGLMQIMPATAKLVARRHGYSRYRLSRLTRVDTNVIIGATYINDLAGRFQGHPAQIAAAYNAGPGRAARWWRRNKKLGPLIYVENIPLLETRLYVKAVLANRAHYGIRLGGKQVSMHDLLSRAIHASAALTLGD